jgi:Carboxypeptidase regulatory-like domain/TonB dependent receptor
VNVRALFALVTLFVWLALGLPARAGTTGGLRGRVVDSVSGAGIAGVKVSAVSPSQSATATTDASGGFGFISLSPDTYLIAIERTGYEPFSLAGVTVQADQVQTTPPIALQKALRTIGAVRTRAASDLVRPGTTSDVYSVNAAGQAAAAAVGGPGGLNQAYSAIATVPGANLPQGQQGWNQLVYIRGGDYSDVANELDGVPVQRASDFAPATTLSSLGQQEVQVYTGGTPPSAEASGLSGFINQVIKSGTYPGYQSLSFGAGAAPFYRKLTFEAGGATRDRNFSYYIGISGVDQDYRYGDNFNGGSPSLFFAPLNVTSNNGTVFDGSGPAFFSPGVSYAIANTEDRENVMNFHFAIPHKSGIKDDIQLLYVNSDVFGQFYSSLDDLGGPALVAKAYGAPATFVDENVYNGQLFAPPDPSKIGIAYSPSTPAHVAFNGLIPDNLRDGDSHGVSILKFQYQRNISATSYLRLFAYSEYNNWLLTGPVSAFLTYGGELQDYEVHGNTFGTTAVYANQINSKNLLTATASYQTQKLETYSGDTFGIITTNLVDKNGNCYSPKTGFYASCFASIYNADGSINPQGGLNQYGQYGFPIAGYPRESLTTPFSPPAGTPAVTNGAQWLVTENGREAQIDEITPFFSALSVADQFRPTEKLNFNLGVRVENFNYRLDDTVDGFPARAFWFQAYDREFCFPTGSTSVSQAGVDPTTGDSNCAPGTNANLVNTSPRTVTFTAVQPRLSFTYGLNADTVVRGSYGRYAAPAPTSYQQYDVVQQDLPSFIGQFLPYGFNTPFHQSRPSYSNNYDLSLEHHFPHTDIAFKLTPFYRSTQDQLANIPIGAQGVLDGLNVGRQRNYGVEFQLRKGDFDRNGLAALLSYTFTRSRVQYNDFGAGGRNEIDNLNDYIRNYNAYTSACASGKDPALCGSTSSGAPAAPCYTPAVSSGSPGQPDPSCAPGSVANPYWNAAAQPLLDRNGEYTPYDILPVGFYGANGYETPHVATLVLNYKHDKFAATPSLTFSAGSSYGSPLVYPGYDPLTCAGTVGTGNKADTTTCSNFLFIPDAYTGKFDSFGALLQPSRLTANMQFSYEASKNVRVTLAMTGVMDRCFQRGYPWDNGTTCVYAQLASNLLAPAGNFVSNPADVPLQLRFPYGSWYNNSQTGFVGQRLPFSAFLTMDVRL